MDSNEPPTTIKEVGIHIGYIRQDQHEMKLMVAKILDNTATKTEVAALQASADKEHTKIWDAIEDIKRSAKWWVGTLLGILAVVVTYFGIIQK